MLPDFDLEELTNFYIQSMAPVVKFDLLNQTTGKIEKSNVSILVWYLHYKENWLDPNTPKHLQYRRELFGVAQVEDTPEQFADQSFYKAHDLTEDDFQRLHIHTRAKMKAHYFLNNLLELRKAHMEKMQEARDKKERELKAEAEARKSKDR